MMNPCYKCEERHMHCHAECEKYQQFAEENEKLRETLFKERMQNEALRFKYKRRKQL